METAQVPGSPPHALPWLLGQWQAHGQLSLLARGKRVASAEPTQHLGSLTRRTEFPLDFLPVALLCDPLTTGVTRESSGQKTMGNAVSLLQAPCWLSAGLGRGKKGEEFKELGSEDALGGSPPWSQPPPR